MSFSEKYKTHLKISKILGSDSAFEEHLAKWSGDVVNSLYEFYQAMGDNCRFKVVISVIPNPSHEKGVDSCKIEVWQTQHKEFPGFTPFIKLMSGSKMTLGECITDINEKLDILTRKDEQQVVEIDGKKYRLVEVK